MPGASVSLKGIKKGVTTSNDGSFSITVPATSKVLVISSIGYVEQEIDISNQSTVSVVLQPKASSLNEVVVVGYGTQKNQMLPALL